MHHSSACCRCCLVTHLLPHPRQHPLLRSADYQRFAVVAVAAAASAVLPATPVRQLKHSKIWSACCLFNLPTLKVVHGAKFYMPWAQTPCTCFEWVFWEEHLKARGVSDSRCYIIIVHLHHQCAVTSVAQWDVVEQTQLQLSIDTLN